MLDVVISESAYSESTFAKYTNGVEEKTLYPSKKINDIAIAKAKELGKSVISAMGAGNKLDPTRFKVADIEKTKIDPLAKVMRRELKKRNIRGVKVVYSEEEPVKRLETPGSVAFVPSVAGLIIAGEIIKDIAL